MMSSILSRLVSSVTPCVFPADIADSFEDTYCSGSNSIDARDGCASDSIGSRDGLWEDARRL